jgi:anaerobic ribonucleoside-triphosphate reductase activating protein
MIDNFIQVAAIEPCSIVNGPYQRSVLWVQGCSKRCDGCWNPNFLPFNGGEKKSIEETVTLLTQDPLIEGVTLSGGEPFSQSTALTELSKRLRQKGLGIMAYSGLTLDEILEDDDKSALLFELDILVDGEYVQTERAAGMWRGSKNQNVHFLTERYMEFFEKVYTEEQRICDAIIKPDGRVTVTGFPTIEFLQMIKRELSGSKLS